MQYREIKKLGTRISTFGMGCMRLPLEADANGDSAKIDINQSIKMIHYAIDNGVNYIDTAYGYHGQHSELVLGKALSTDGYRNRTLIATKFPTQRMVYSRYDELKSNPSVVENIVDEQLRKLETDHIDVYLIHGLDNRRWPLLKAVDFVDILDKIRGKGKIRFLGFSFHDKLSCFKSIIDYFDWDMCQIQLNIVDYNFQAGVSGLKYAASKGIPVAIMEPLRGGSLANNIPAEVSNVWNNCGISRSVVDWCFRWICNFPEVMTVLSGVSSMEQIEKNVRMFDDMLPGSMSPEELAIVKKVRHIYYSRIKVKCTGCGYCMPCPNNVKIISIFSIYNGAHMVNNLNRGKKEYSRLVLENNDASQCIKCGKCQEECPQNLPITDKLEEAANYLTS